MDAFSTPPKALSDNLRTEWFQGKDFTTDWMSWNAGHWSSIVAGIQPSPRILEIGSWEGRSAIAWLNLLPGSHITCIDNWPLSETEKRFDANLSPYASRLEKLSIDSRLALEFLISARRTFDFVYIDGDHTREGTLRDSVLAWTMLKVGGVLLWDDYLYDIKPDMKDRPREAIDWFLEAYKTDINVLHRGYQLAVRKLTMPTGRDSSASGRAGER